VSFQPLGARRPSTSLAVSFERRDLKIWLGCCLITLCALSAQGGWEPGNKPDPDRILSEAQEDAAAGRYEDALAKHVWFHENALKYAPAMLGVRLSFALSYWTALGAKYPPALQRLRAIRDTAGEELRNGGDIVGPSSDCGGPEVRRAFGDFSAINRELGEDVKTSMLFVWLDANRPLVAAVVYEVAEPALIGEKKYKLCGKYLDPDRSFQWMVRLRGETMNMAADPGGPLEYAKELKEFEEKSFSHKVATLVAVLAMNGRKADAKRIAVEALKVQDDTEFRRLLSKAQNGDVPPPWP
jgi:hypothetical protein